MKPLKTEQILVVDDDFAVGDLIVAILKNSGFKHIDVVKSGEEALIALKLNPTIKDSLKKNPYDIIILDIVLPDINGFDLCAKIKKSYTNTPIMLMSGYDIKEIQFNILKCGVDDFLKKPFNPSELITRINLLLLKYKQQEDSETHIDDSFPELNLSTYNKIPYIGDKIDNYMIIDSLAFGQTSIIYKVINLETHKIFALKMLTGHSKESKEITERFTYEIEIMSKINHPSIIAFHDSGVFNDFKYLVMEYFEGVNLEELIISQGRISEQLILKIAYELADAISEIHKNDIIHRDIKLKNALFDPLTTKIKICDFGIAQLPDIRNLTNDGNVVGTPMYMAPENFHGDRATVQSDIYSYGATIYHLLTNSPPYVAKNYLDFYNKINQEPPIPISEIRPKISKTWNSLIVDKCLACNAYDRPESMESILLELTKMKLFI